MKLNIFAKLMLGFLSLVMIMVVIGVFSMTQIEALDSKTKAIGNDDLPSTLIVGKIDATRGSYRRSQLLHILSDTPEAKAGFEKDLESDAADMAGFFKEYEASISDDQDRALWNKVQDNWHQYVTISSAFLEPSRKGDSKTAFGILMGDARTVYNSGLGTSLTDWTNLNLEKANQDVKSADQARDTAYTLIIALMVGAAVVSCLVGFFVTRDIVSPLKIMAGGLQSLSLGDLNRNVPQKVKDIIMARTDELGTAGKGIGSTEIYLQNMAEIAQKIADGDLTVDVTPRSEKDELGQAFAQMVANLRQTIGNVAENATQLGSASGQLALASSQAGQATSQISATIQQVAAGIGQQTESVSRTATSVEQMGRTIEGVARGAREQSLAVGKASNVASQISTAIQQVAANAQTSAKGANQAATTARSGAKTVAETIRGMQSIQAKVGFSAQKVEEMGKRSDQIGTIVETIDDIASQTNLLALNAAIEAARAGEHGKGFAVVADEVRKLAERSSNATKEIGSLIRDIQKTVAEAVVAMEESSHEVEDGVERANQSDEALGDILKAVEVVNSQVDEIATAASRIGVSSNELLVVMESVSRVVAENMGASEQMAGNSNQVTIAVENIASVSEENSASVEEVSASTEEMSAQVEEVSASAQVLSEMAQDLQQLVAQFKLEKVAQSIPAKNGERLVKRGNNGTFSNGDKTRAQIKGQEVRLYQRQV